MDTTAQHLGYRLAQDLSFAFDRDGELSFKYMLRGYHDEVITIRRTNQRWRVCGGYLCSSHTIASSVFEYPENPPRDMCEFMGMVFDLVGKVADAADQAIAEVKRKHKERSQLARLWEDQRRLIVQPQLKPSKPSFVYLMRHDNGLIKIGFSHNPKSRERTLQAEDPRLELLFAFKGDAGTERRLHKIYDAVRVRGEWFSLPSHHVDWIAAVFSVKVAKNKKRSTGQTKRTKQEPKKQTICP